VSVAFIGSAGVGRYGHRRNLAALRKPGSSTEAEVNLEAKDKVGSEIPVTITRKPRVQQSTLGVFKDQVVINNIGTPTPPKARKRRGKNQLAKDDLV
jgi:hypothetical protein